MYFLEILLLSLIGFRWFVIFLGFALLLYRIYWQTKVKRHKSELQIFNFIIIVVFLMVAFSAYTILVIDFRIPLPTF